VAREAFTAQRFRDDTLAVVLRANEVCAEYKAQGYDLTLRQVYYQFVARGWLGNNQRNYKRLGDIINNARLAGLMDWDYIQDRTRNVSGSFGGYDDPGNFVEEMKDYYHEAVWRDQPYRPEVWVEKDALVDVVGQACEPLRVPYFSCRGYVSQSEMYDAAKRMQRRAHAGHRPVVVHLGDHDPSGVDMSRDIEDRLSLMAGFQVDVRRVALTMDQIDQYAPPPNPTKFTDARAAGYIERYGYESWELDALEPSVLTALISDTVTPLVDRDLWDAAVEAEDESKDRLALIADRWEDLESAWEDVLDVIGR
jgi:hypothetical protein